MGPVKYMVYWKDMLRDKQGDAPMRDFDTKIEARSYIQGMVDSIITFTNDKNEVSLKQEFEIKEILHDNTKNQN
tara:strand:- start:454 stop:675 length:222 start_codon:yes stop_codon:yes gene_type:complete